MSKECDFLYFLLEGKIMIAKIEKQLTKTFNALLLFIVHSSQTTDVDKCRKNGILNILLIGAVVLSSISFFITIATTAISLIQGVPYTGTSYLISLGFTCFFLLLYLLFRLQQTGLATHLLLLTYFIGIILCLEQVGVASTQGLILIPLLIVMSGILVSSRYAFFVSLAVSILVIVMHLRLADNQYPYFYWREAKWNFYDVLGFIAVFFIIALVSWLSNREIDRSLALARASEQTLKEERDLLEVKVDERTRAIKQLQIERVAQMYRFAEFGRLSSSLFHDLVNPLTAISLNLRSVEHSHTSQTTNAFLQNAIQATEKMEHFVNAVRKQFQKQETLEVFSLAEEVEQVISIMRHRGKSLHVHINFTQPKTTLYTYGNPLKFAQLVMNLLSNALDAYQVLGERKKSQRREIRITLWQEEKGNQILISLQDWGVGIAKEQQQQIFDPFFTSKEKGIGIGLTTCKDIVEKHFHGSIDIESTLGKGTRFVIAFPFQLPPMTIE